MGRLFWKIFFAFWLTLIAAAIGTGMAISLQREERDGPAPELAGGRIPALATELASVTLRHGGVPALREWMRESQRTRGPSLFAVDSEGRDLLGRPVPAAALTRARELAAAGGARAAREVTAPGGEPYLLFMPVEGEPRRGRRPGPPPPTWLLVLIGAAASLAVSALLAWYLARPIRSLRWAFRSAAQGRLETRVRPLMKGRRDEIADLGEDFDQMAQQLQKLVAAQRRLLHDVSHELRSPLARLQAATGLVRQSPEKLEASLERIEREVMRLDELVGEVLTLARLESGAAGAAAQPIDFAELVADVAEDARFEAEAANRRLSLKSVDEARVHASAELLHRAVENVVRNAVKYTAEGTGVELELAVQAGKARLVVADRGPGIAPEELERVFEPFYRTSSDTAKGFGLGLAIAQRAIASHGGTVRAAAREGGGLRVAIELPLFTPDAAPARSAPRGSAG
jgi:two-component system, OmpR family, sensor kinase